MKIYNELVLKWNKQTQQYDQVLYEDSFEYNGPIAHASVAPCCTSSDFGTWECRIENGEMILIPDCINFGSPPAGIQTTCEAMQSSCWQGFTCLSGACDCLSSCGNDVCDDQAACNYDTGNTVDNDTCTYQHMCCHSFDGSTCWEDNLGHIELMPVCATADSYDEIGGAVCENAFGDGYGIEHPDFVTILGCIDSGELVQDSVDYIQWMSWYGYRMENEEYPFNGIPACNYNPDATVEDGSCLYPTFLDYENVCEDYDWTDPEGVAEAVDEEQWCFYDDMDCSYTCFGEAELDCDGNCCDEDWMVYEYPDFGSDNECLVDGDYSSDDCCYEDQLDECNICFGSGKIYGNDGNCCPQNVDSCGICNGPNTNCNSNTWGTNVCPVRDCNGDCFGGLINDECGVCDGPGLGNAEYYICPVNDVEYCTEAECITTGSCSGHCGEYFGEFEEENGTCSCDEFCDMHDSGDPSRCCDDICWFCPDIESVDGIPIGQSNFCIEQIYGCMNEDACNYDPDATIEGENCYYGSNSYGAPDPSYDCFEPGTCNYDCDGNCNYVEDCAGVCNGTAVEDCNGDCGGTTVVDECGECDGPGAIQECWDGSLVCDAGASPHVGGECPPGPCAGNCSQGYGCYWDGGQGMYVCDCYCDHICWEQENCCFDYYAENEPYDSGCAYSCQGQALDVGYFSGACYCDTDCGYNPEHYPCCDDFCDVILEEWGHDAVDECGVCAGNERASWDCNAFELYIYPEMDDAEYAQYISTWGLFGDTSPNEQCWDFGVDDSWAAHNECCEEVIEYFGECTDDDCPWAACNCLGHHKDCNEECGGTTVVDECGNCGGDGYAFDFTDEYGIDHPGCLCTCNTEGGCVCTESCNDMDCNGDCGGSAYVDACEWCVGGNTGLEPCVEDCTGTSCTEDCAYADACSICSGGTSEHTPNECTGRMVNGVCFEGWTGPDFDCAGQCGSVHELGGPHTQGPAYIDDCGICAGGISGNDSPNVCTGAMDDGICSEGWSGPDFDCAGQCNGPAQIDDCDYCWGGITNLEENWAWDCHQVCDGQATIRTVTCYQNVYNMNCYCEVGYEKRWSWKTGKWMCMNNSNNDQQGTPQEYICDADIEGS